LTLPLEPTDDRAAPIFTDAASCTAWLAQFQLTNLRQAHGQLLTQLTEFNRYPMPGLERFHTLEALRETLAHIQEDMAKKLVAKALPLGEHELMIFVAIIQLWQAMVTGYQRCLQAYVAGDKKLADMGAMLCERCLQYSGSGIFEHLRSGYECNPKFWYQLHDLYAFAEAQGFQEVDVPDALNRYVAASSCRSLYVKMLLACYARPSELSRTQLKLLDRWLAAWSKEVRVEARYSLSKGDAQPLAIDLSSTQGLRAVALGSHSKHMRYLPMMPMSKLLRVKIILLQQGASLDQVGLGELPSNAAAIELLTFLHWCWCEEDRDRGLKRNTIGEPVQFCYTPDMIFAYLNGKVVVPHKHNMDSMARKQMEIFGRVLPVSSAQPAADNQEGWLLDDESVMGAKLTRHGLVPGRLNLHQLVAVRRDESRPFKLGAVAWLQVSVQGLLQLGVSYVPGIPEPVHIQVPGGAQQAAFLLPEEVALRTPPSLILPRHVYKADGMLQIVFANGEKKHVKMGISVTRGFDYERISFSLA
jgi:hypothetical protein